MTYRIILEDGQSAGWFHCPERAVRVAARLAAGSATLTLHRSSPCTGAGALGAALPPSWRLGIVEAC